MSRSRGWPRCDQPQGVAAATSSTRTARCASATSALSAAPLNNGENTLLSAIEGMTDSEIYQICMGNETSLFAAPPSQPIQRVRFKLCGLPDAPVLDGLPPPLIDDNIEELIDNMNVTELIDEIVGEEAGEAEEELYKLLSPSLPLPNEEETTSLLLSMIVEEPIISSAPRPAPPAAAPRRVSFVPTVVDHVRPSGPFQMPPTTAKRRLLALPPPSPDKPEPTVAPSQADEAVALPGDEGEAPEGAYDDEVDPFADSFEPWC